MRDAHDGTAYHNVEPEKGDDGVAAAAAAAVFAGLNAGSARCGDCHHDLDS